MNDDLAVAIERLQDPTASAWYRERCHRAYERSREIVSSVQRGGHAAQGIGPGAPTTAYSIVVDPQVIESAEYKAEHELSVYAFSIADVYLLWHRVVVENHAPPEVVAFPHLIAELQQAPTRASLVTEHDVVDVMRALGFRRMTLDEWNAGVDLRRRDFVDVGAMLESDINGWLSGEPRSEALPNKVVPLQASVASWFQNDRSAEIARVARTIPAWRDEVESVLHAYGGVERLTPVAYPSFAWTVDLGPVRNGAFRAHFLTDFYVSKLAPLWYFTNRFIVENGHPEAIEHELEGWSVFEIGYTRRQTALVNSVREMFTGHGIDELDPSRPWYQVSPSDDSDEYRTLNEWFFRDVRGVAERAPLLEEEHPNREVRARRGRLRNS